jgi:hypothetical protein
VVVFSDFLYPISCPDDDKKGGSSRRGTVQGFVYSSLVEPGLFQLLWVFPRTSEVAFEVTDHYDPQRGLEYLDSYNNDNDQHDSKYWQVLLDRAKREVRTDSEERQYKQTNIQHKLSCLEGIMACDGGSR